MNRILFEKYAFTFEGMLLSVILVLVIQTIWTNQLIGNDAFFHYRYALEMPLYSEHGLPQLYYSIHREEFINLQWGYHLLLKPFLIFGKMDGAKLFISANLLLILFSAFALVRSLSRENCILLTVVLLLLSVDFVIRVTMLRPHVMAIWIYIFYLYGIYSQSRQLIAVSTVMAVVSYPLFPMIFVTLLINVCVHGYPQSKTKIFYSLLGFALGSLVHPGGPYHIFYACESIFRRIISGDSFITGSEWYPMKLSEIFYDNGLLALVVVSIVVLVLFRDKVNIQKNLFFLYTFVFVFLLFSLTGRIIDFFVPVAVFVLATLLPKIPLGCRVFAWIFVVMYAVYFFSTLNEKIEATKFDYVFYDNVLKVPASHADPQLIYNVNWSDFSRLYYVAPNLRYIAGLDLNFLKEYDQQLFQDYYQILTDPENAKLYSIRTSFMADWVLVDHSKPGQKILRDRLMRNDGFILYFEDSVFTLFRVGS